MQYFDHDTNASSDPKIIELRLSCGGAAVDAYWYLLERMYMDEQPLCICNGDASAMRVHAHCLCTDVDTVCKWVETMISAGLFKVDEATSCIYSERAIANIESYHEKAEKRRSAANKRWSKEGSDASAMQVQSKSNAKKRKENKRKESSAIKSTTTLSADGKGKDEALPPSEVERSVSPFCPHCSSPLNITLKGFDCESHGIIPTSEVVYR